MPKMTTFITIYLLGVFTFTSQSVPEPKGCAHLSHWSMCRWHYKHILNELVLKIALAPSFSLLPNDLHIAFGWHSIFTDWPTKQMLCIAIVFWLKEPPALIECYPSQNECLNFPEQHHLVKGSLPEIVFLNLNPN